jgi:pyruvate dehydrogenase E2 component (dihydrolipoamide acetyltransferase)
MRKSCLTMLAFVAWAMSRTLPGFERLNATVEESDTGEARALAVHSAVHLGIAVDLDGEGLIVPVVRDAQTMDVAGLAAEIARVSTAARAGELTPDDVAGATCTLSGQGPHGTLFTVPIINQPQVATLSVDGIGRRPAVVGEGETERVEPRDTGVLALSWDHRAIDGLYAARFLAALRDTLQHTDFAQQAAVEGGRS